MQGVANTGEIEYIDINPAELPDFEFLFMTDFEFRQMRPLPRTIFFNRRNIGDNEIRAALNFEENMARIEEFDRFIMEHSPNSERGIDRFFSLHNTGFLDVLPRQVRPPQENVEIELRPNMPIYEPPQEHQVRIRVINSRRRNNRLSEGQWRRRRNPSQDEQERD